MAVFLSNNVGFKIGTVDLSDHVKSFSISQKFDELEISAMGDTAHRFTKGLESCQITVSFLNDDSTGSVLATLEAAYGTSASFKALQQKGTAVGAENKLYSGVILINNLTPINGAVGDVSTQDITFTVNGPLTVADTGSF